LSESKPALRGKQLAGSVISRLFSVENKVAVITGATSGIGLMMAEGLVAAGARVYIVARNESDCTRVAAELKRLGDCVAIPGDLATVEGIREVAAAFGKAEERLHILVNNAGIFKTQPIDEYSEELWDYTMALNTKAAFFLTQQLLPHLRRGAAAADPARIVNIGSGHGIRVSPFESYAYQTSKAGLHHLTLSLARRLAREHINVNAIAPGVFPSRLTADFNAATVSAITSNIPRGRYGNAEDMAGTLIYLCSPAGAYVTAAVIPVDGGWAGAT
jgi:NAD(P)-dependent dehydrogenase (short-subunit alcohol dehydrogenase family)